MNAEDAIDISEMVAAICPVQRFNEMTPDTWAVLLADVDRTEAEQALQVLGKTNEFISPKDIIAQVGRDRRRRRAGYVPPAPVNPDDEAGYRAQMRAANRAASRPPMNGRLAVTAGDAVVRRRAAELRAADGGRVVEAGTASRHLSGRVREALALARQRCEEASRERWGDDPPRKRWTPPPNPEAGDRDPVRVSSAVFREALRRA